MVHTEDKAWHNLPARTVAYFRFCVACLLTTYDNKKERTTGFLNIYKNVKTFLTSVVQVMTRTRCRMPGTVEQEVEWQLRRLQSTASFQSVQKPHSVVCMHADCWLEKRGNVVEFQSCLGESWWCGIALMHHFRSIKLLYAGLPGPVSTWMGDCLRAGKPSRYVSSHPGRLSLLPSVWW